MGNGHLIPNGETDEEIGNLGKHHITPFSPPVITDMVSTRWQAPILSRNPKTIGVFAGAGCYYPRRYSHPPLTPHPPSNA